jgi:hypothetical protein
MERYYKLKAKENWKRKELSKPGIASMQVAILLAVQEDPVP